jgi:hypothetical protein
MLFSLMLAFDSRDFVSDKHTRNKSQDFQSFHICTLLDADESRIHLSSGKIFKAVCCTFNVASDSFCSAN